MQVSLNHARLNAIECRPSTMRHSTKEVNQSENEAKYRGSIPDEEI